MGLQNLLVVRVLAAAVTTALLLFALVGKNGVIVTAAAADAASATSKGGADDGTATCSVDNSHVPECLAVPTVRLHNGVEMPLLQLGTAHLITKRGIDDRVPYNFTGILPERTHRQLQVALHHGIRAFDSALIYRSHVAIGSVLGEWWRTERLSNGRSDVWLTTKVFHPDARAASFGQSHMPHLSNMTVLEVEEMTRRQVETSLLELGVGYVDLLLLHWPSAKHASSDEDDGDNSDSQASIPISIHRQRRLAAWRVLEEFYKKGWTRAIGVSNFSPTHINDLMSDGGDAATIKPMVNQIEASVTLQYSDILSYCLEHDIVPQAYSPFGRGLTALPDAVQDIAKRRDMTPGQVAIQYLLQLGYAVVYLSNTAEHMVSNTRVAAAAMNGKDNPFRLSDNDMAVLQSLHRPDGGWGLPSPHELP